MHLVVAVTVAFALRERLWPSRTAPAPQGGAPTGVPSGGHHALLHSRRATEA